MLGYLRKPLPLPPQTCPGAQRTICWGGGKHVETRKRFSRRQGCKCWVSSPLPLEWWVLMPSFYFPPQPVRHLWASLETFLCGVEEEGRTHSEFQRLTDQGSCEGLSLGVTTMQKVAGVLWWRMGEEDGAGRSRTQSGDTKCLQPSSISYCSSELLEQSRARPSCLGLPGAHFLQNRPVSVSCPDPAHTHTPSWPLRSGPQNSTSSVGSFTPVLSPGNMELLAFLVFCCVFFFAHCLPCI